MIQLASVYTDLYMFLTLVPDLFGIVAYRIYPMVCPPSTEYPYIIYRKVSNVPEYAQSGETGADLRIQFECRAKDPATAAYVRDVLTAALVGYKGPLYRWGATVMGGCFIETETQDVNPVLGEYTEIVDIRMILEGANA